MAEPFLSEIRLMSFGYAPRGWAQCNGQLMPISQNQALFKLLGSTFGGDGTTSFGLPNLQGAAPLHVGGGHVLGESGGEQDHTLVTEELPEHTHVLQGTSDAASVDVPESSELLAQTVIDMYRAPTNLTAMDPGCVSNVGGGQAHVNMQPFLALNFCIAIQGIYPSAT
ncbi:phage tail protein [Caenimonas aquaedulcis]|uniref:Phage tail protein n=1 Tax=Caenimonas aquaedulcis TaxID=2793270 RepID=A0A931MHQ3_9BURK|nr:tail fiber protein [Caenimonas aquaedulcis]MBG9388415.1 phage tail protein [Caenimonas aquaedulcis]